MNGLVGSPAPPFDPSGAQVAADGWFPPVTLDTVRAGLRLGSGVITTARLTAAIEGAMLTALRELADWRMAQVLAGKANLAEVTGDQLNGKSLGVLLWERTIRFLAGAELADENRDISATDQGLDRTEERGDVADDYRRLAWAAIADLRSVGASEPVARNRVDLI